MMAPRNGAIIDRPAAARAPPMTTPRHRDPGQKLAMFAMFAMLAAALVVSQAGCVEAAVHEKTARELDAATRASAYKDQQIRSLAWQVAALQAELQRARAESDTARRDLAPKLDQMSAEHAACAAELARNEAARRELAASLAAEAAPGRRGRPDEMRRLKTAMDAQNARLMERLDRLEQKLDPARRQKPRSADADIVDPWGFGSRK